MKPLSVVYSIRACLGFVAGAMCVLLRLDDLLTGIMLGIFFYLLTYYVLKHFFVAKVEKPSKIMTMGIGAYFLTFAVAFGLLFTLVIPTAVFTYSPDSPVVGQTVTFDATGSYDLFGDIESFAWDFDDETTGTGNVATHTYTNTGTYTVTLNVTDNDGHTSTSQKVVTVTNSTET
ncbi:MAG: PKD domain-containing protein [Candidatus Bathyarchaeota archaeon]|nr:MAG: PKD domain-containing protein [Candidatus Bathyarchaeota archaeon]